MAHSVARVQSLQENTNTGITFPERSYQIGSDHLKSAEDQQRTNNVLGKLNLNLESVISYLEQVKVLTL